MPLATLDGCSVACGITIVECVAVLPDDLDQLLPKKLLFTIVLTMLNRAKIGTRVQNAGNVVVDLLH